MPQPPKLQPDKRVHRTQQALRSALLGLIVERGYEHLSVQHILDRASVGRATFYLHYRGKEDLLRRSLDELRQGLLRQWKQQPDEVRPSPLGFTLAFFRHVDAHRPLYKAIVGRESGAIVDRQMRRLLLDVVSQGIAQSAIRKRSQAQSEMAAHFAVGALMSTLTWWLDYNSKLSPVELNQAFHEMASPLLT